MKNNNPKDNLASHIGGKIQDAKTDVWERKDYINKGVIGAKHMIKTQGKKGGRKIKIKVNRK